MTAPAPEVPRHASASAATAGVYSHHSAAAQAGDATGCRVATGSSCRLAPIAVITSTPSVIRCSAASGQARPPANDGASAAPTPSDSQPSRWKNTAAPK